MAHQRYHHRIACLLLPLGVLVASGCAGREATPLPPLPGDAADAATARSTGVSIADAFNEPGLFDPIQETLAPADLFPPYLLRGVFQRTVADGSQQMQPYMIEPTGDGWTLSVEDVGRTFFEQDDSGRLLLVGTEDLVENVRVAFNPGMVVLPANLAEASVVEDTVEMVVYNLDNGRQRDRGTSAYRMEILGRGSVATPAGDFDSVAVRFTRQIRLSLAQVQADSVQAFAPGEGLVAEAAQRQVRALGFFGNSTAYRLERAE